MFIINVLLPVGLEQAPRQQHGGTESRMQKQFSFGGPCTVKLPVSLAGLLPDFRVFMFGFLWISCLYLFWAESLCVYLYTDVIYMNPPVYYFVVYLFFPLRLLLD